MAKQLTEVEIFFIRENLHLPIAELKEKLLTFETKEIEALVSHFKDKHVDTVKKVDSQDAFITGNIMAKREGMAMMNAGASELADARTKTYKSNVVDTSDRIHKINPSKK